jgi:hypothetical protein
MKKLSVFICVHLWTIFLFFSVSAQEFKTIRDGIEYAEMTRGTKEEPVHVDLLRLDLTKVRLDVAHAMDAAIGLEKTSSIAARYGAFAAINAGFFRLDNSIFRGDATGVLMIDNQLYSESYGGRAALMISNQSNVTRVSIDRMKVGNTITIKGRGFDAGINRQRGENDLVMFTNFFHRTTLTDNNGAEFIVRNKIITKILDGSGSNVIPFDGYILSASGSTRETLIKLIKKGTKVDLFFGGSTPNGIMRPPDFLFQAEDIVSGVPQLIKNGKIEITWQQEKSSKEFAETRHPRTAVAKLKDGKFLMVAVDGRQAGYSVGMNLNELAEFLLELGAVEAMNLDGGGSTTMFLNGKIVNRPSDKEGERSVSDAILVFPRKKN